MTESRSQREIQAETEVGHTTVRPTVALSLVLFFLLVITAPLFWDGCNPGQKSEAFRPLDEAIHLAPRAEDVARSVRTLGLTRGVATLNRQTQQRMLNFENRLQSTSRLRNYLLTPMNQFFSGLLGAGNADVYPGQGDWLFYGPAVRHVTGPAFLTQPFHGDGVRATDPLTAILAFQSKLAARNIALVLAPVPSKASIYPKLLSNAFDGKVAVYNASYICFLERVREAGVLVCDFAPELLNAKENGLAYLRQDTHWSPAGMERCAAALGRLIDAQVPLPLNEEHPYQRGETVAVTYRGDLSAMLYPAVETQNTIHEQITIQPILDTDAAPWTATEGSAVLLLGDSFTNVFSQSNLGWGGGAGLAEQLSFYMQRPVDRIARNDHGAFASREALSDELARGNDRLANTRVVVYEFAARELSWGDWKTGLPMEVGSRQTDPPQQAQITVTGRILERSVPPTPGSVPYKDCIVSLLIETSSPTPQTLLVRGWGMRNHGWTALTGWHVGDKVTLELQPWTQVSDMLDSINRVPLERDQHVLLKPWWLRSKEPVTNNLAIPAAASNSPASAREDLGLVELVQHLESTKQSVLEGRNGWFFFTPELRSMSVGAFWGEAAQRLSRARNKKYADPLPAILDFHQQLAGAGIELILVPVPPKAGIYTDQVGDSKLTNSLRASMAPDGPLASFLTQLRTAGVTVIDLQTAFASASDIDKEPLYCKTDTHWSPRGCAMAADLVAKQIRALPWYPSHPKRSYETKHTTLTLHGDLSALQGAILPAELLPIDTVGITENEAFLPVVPDRESPVLLIGDSHNLVFHAGGDMHATGAGLPDLLANALGFPVDLVAVRGSGATTPRISLARRQDRLSGKNVVVWCFSSREFTESTTGWRKIPVIP